jgi:hypothetical protein
MDDKLSAVKATLKDLSADDAAATTDAASVPGILIVAKDVLPKLFTLTT